jgi:3'(2'), 5'-bisphosphate nucleotidase
MSSNCAVQEIIRVAQEAGRAILQIYEGKDLDIAFKSDKSPLTRADMAAHHLIVTELQKLTPALPVLSEESKSIPYQDRHYWDTYWLVDPLDGTKEFISRNGEFTVNIALIQKGTPVLGVVHAPLLELTYFAVRGEGAFRQKSAEGPVKVAVNDYCGGNLKIVGSRSHLGESLKYFLQSLKNHELVSMGSSLKFCLIADGTAHFYPRLGPTMEWDTAAGQCLVEQAGGVVTDLQGKPLSYNKPNLLNPSFVANGTSSNWWQEFLPHVAEMLAGP